MATEPFVQRASQAAAEAIRAEDEGHTRDAIYYYRTALGELMGALQLEPREYGKRCITFTMGEYLDRLCVLEANIDDDDDKEPLILPTVPSKRAYEQTHEAISTQQEQLVHVEGSDTTSTTTNKVLPHKGGSERMTDVIGMDAVKEVLATAVILPEQIPQIFTGTRVAPRAILMYGPSGVGKTLIVKALANECNRALFAFKASDIFERWVGSSERNVKAMFETVRAARPAVLFLDEIDALCRNRDSGESSPNDLKPLNEMLIELDGLGSDMRDVLVIGATNRPEALDAGVLSRFDRKIYVPLPDRDARYCQLEALLSKNSDDVGEPLDAVALLQLAQELEHYSGREITHLVEAAQGAVLQSIVHATHFRRARTRDGRDVMVPCEEGTPNCITRSFTELTAEHKHLIGAPMLTLGQLRKARELVKPVVDTERLAQFEEWTRKHGQHSAQL